MSKLHKTNGKYLWWCLQSLEFKPDVPAKNIKHLNLGVNMFDKPNKEASYIVIHFLFEKLNPTRLQDVFRHCWPIWDHKCDAEFRRVTFGWLQEIANEEGSAFPKVAASHLLSPSGPRFINLMLHLAKHVMLKTLKTFAIDDTWVPEAAALSCSSHELEMKRFQVVKRQFQRVTVEQDRLIQDYQKRAKGLENSLRDLDAEDAKYEHLLAEQVSNTDLEGEIIAKIQKVRGLWAETDRVLSTLQGDGKAVESVIHGQADQYTLDGQDLSVKIPTVLRERLERLSHQSSVGNLYEAGQPVLLRLLEVLNEGLCLLHEEREKIAGATRHLHHQDLQEQALLFSRSKENLKIIRRKLVREDAADIQSSIQRLEEDWEKKWAECLKNTPLVSFLKEEPVLDFVSPMAPFSFEPASEASFKASIISQYHKLPKPLEETSHRRPKGEEMQVYSEPKVHLEPEFKNTSLASEDKRLLSCGRLFSPRTEIPSKVPQCETPLTCLVKVQPVVQTPSPVRASHRKSLFSKKKSSIIKNKAQILDLECDNLANQFADAVIMSPVNGRNDVDLGQLLNAISDPFSSRKQLCRTPESLIEDVRSSWRKAMEEGMSEKKQASWTQDSLSWLKMPLDKAEVNRSSPEPSLLFDTFPPVQQGASLHSTVSWDSSQLEDLHNQSTRDVIQFSIAHEELPELFEDEMSFDSEGSMELQGNKENEELLLLPVRLHSPEGQSPLLLSFDATLNKDACIKSDLKTPIHSQKTSGMNLWGDDETLFSLDLDKLENVSPPLTEKLTLPNLVDLSLDDY
ncbi:HAUS augmin-like complex subunit 6 [Triplophysa tibetana]|uniref:HAUS augmin-like complex subunit 6 n=1 Tax=Triplophysa tibetana TaxID=1572043 RepID=A0A5A9PQ03_9TELE|nr:HAUS augmin-like complex subunit 6 [Triplophysa tibetana]